MRQYFQFAILLISLVIYSCDYAGQGLEIYLVKHDFPNFTNEKRADCYYCFSPIKNDLFDKPLLVESDIQYFEWTNQQIKLTDVGLDKIKKLDIPLQGLAAAIVVDGQPVYGFWFWNIISSFGCDRVFTYPTLDFKIAFGLPSDNTKGEDPRFDSKLREYLTKSGLIK